MNNKSGLSVWQLTMMALGTVIGGSFFIGSSVVIHAVGPGILLSFAIGGLLVYFILFALSEMTVANPDSGSFRTFAARIFGPGTGYVVGWVYWTGMVLGMSSEATAAAILLHEWTPFPSIAVMGVIIIIGITGFNLLGAEKLSRLESGLAAVKIFAIVSFVLIAVLLIIGLFPGTPAVGTSTLRTEPWLPDGFKGIAGGMLIVMFSYAGFEILGLAAAEARDSQTTVPKAIRQTVLTLVGLYIATIALLLFLIPTAQISENTSPIVSALNRYGINWAGTAIRFVLITAILSTMLAAMFGLGRVMRSLADEGYTPGWLKDKREIPYRGILASGLGMLAALGLGLLFPNAYFFLISSGGFAMLFIYAVIMATHYFFRKKNGCPPNGKCQVWGYPYTTIFTFLALVFAIVSMPFVKGQSAGLIAGSCLLLFYIVSYFAMRFYQRKIKPTVFKSSPPKKKQTTSLSTEFSRELSHQESEHDWEDRF